MPEGKTVDQFILEQIDTVPHLEALLLVWQKRPNAWSAHDMAKALYLSPDAAKTILADLVKKGLLREHPPSSGQYHYDAASAGADELIALVDRTYRRELIRISKLIHSKAPSALEEFARAFRFTKEKD